MFGGPLRVKRIMHVIGHQEHVVDLGLLTGFEGMAELELIQPEINQRMA